MAAGTDLAGVIGTWVAVALALTALFGIVTPVLLIRRARSERNTALNLIDDKDQDFVRVDIKVPGLPRIARSIKAPNLENPPVIDGHCLLRDDGVLERTHSTTSWVMFVKTLYAYGIEVPSGGTLKIHNSRSWLPVHRLWILTIGLLGRYAHRADQGRVSGAPLAARIDQRDVESVDPKALSGITGTLRYKSSALSSDAEQGFGQIYFTPRDKDTRGSLQPDNVPLGVLFWFAMGCVPLLDGRVFDISRKNADLSGPQVTHLPSQRHRNYQGAHEEQYQSSDNTSGDEGRDSSDSFGILQTRRTSLLKERDVKAPKVKAYRFQLITNLMPGARIILWAQSLLGKVPELYWMRKYTPIISEEKEQAEELLSNTDDHEGISSLWIKSESMPVRDFLPRESLLWRSDIQCLALAILKLEWSPRGSLFDSQRGMFCRQILCTASTNLYSLLKAGLKLNQNTVASRSGRADLINAIKIVLPMCSWRVTFGFSRDLHEALFNLEQALVRISNRAVPSLAVRVAFTTSKIFRDFVRAAVADGVGDDESSKILTVDPGSKHLLVTSGNLTPGIKFAMNFEEVFGEERTLASFSLTYEEVLLAALGACVRSVAFQFSYDSQYLLNFVEHIGESVYVSAQFDAPRSASSCSTDEVFWVEDQEPKFFPMVESNANDKRKDDDDDTPDRRHTDHKYRDNSVRRINPRHSSDDEWEGHHMLTNHSRNFHNDLDDGDDGDGDGDGYGYGGRIQPRGGHTDVSDGPRPDGYYSSVSNRKPSWHRIKLLRLISDTKLNIMVLELEREIVLRKTALRQVKAPILRRIGDRIEQNAKHMVHPKLARDGVPGQESMLPKQARTSLGTDLKTLEEKRLTFGREIRSLKREFEKRKHELKEQIFFDERSKDQNGKIDSFEESQIHDGELRLLQLREHQVEQQLLLKKQKDHFEYQILPTIRRRQVEEQGSDPEFLGE